MFTQDLTRHFCFKYATRVGRFISIAPSSAHIFPFQPVFNSPWGLATCGPVGGAPLPEDASAPCGFGTAAIGAAIGDALGFGTAAFLPGGGYAGGRGPLATLPSTSSVGTAGGGKGGVGGKAGAGSGVEMLVLVLVQVGEVVPQAVTH